MQLKAVSRPSPRVPAGTSTSSGVDYRLPPNAAFVSIRFGACYGDGDGNGTTLFAYPQLVQTHVEANANALSMFQICDAQGSKYDAATGQCSGLTTQSFDFDGESNAGGNRWELVYEVADPGYAGALGFASYVWYVSTRAKHWRPHCRICRICSRP